MTDIEIKTVNAYYGKIRNTFTHNQVSMLTSMLVTLGKEWEAREKVEEYNAAFHAHNEKMRWDKNYKPTPMLPVPEIKCEVQKPTTQKITEEKKGA